jgi:hypothetical protein
MMIRYLKNRFRDYIQDIIAEKVDAIAALASEMVNVDSVVDTVLERVKAGPEVEYDLLAEQISIEDLAQQFDVADIAGEVDHSEIASALDTSDIASEISVSDLAGELDAEDIAGHIDLSDVADYIDYQKLAVALLHAVKSGAL